MILKFHVNRKSSSVAAPEQSI